MSVAVNKRWTPPERRSGTFRKLRWSLPRLGLRRVCGTSLGLALGCLLVVALPCRAEPAAEFDAANKLYEQGKFPDATAAYERLLTNGPTAALHFNLGNSRFKRGQPGKAIFHYHHALRLAPRDPDIHGNLHFARRSLGATVDESLGRQLLRKLTGDEWAWVAGGALGLWFLLLAAGEGLPGKRAAFAWLTRTCGGAALVSIGLLVAAHAERRLAAEAVVVVAEAPVRPGPLAESKVAFSLRDGTEVEVLDAKGDWVQVRASQQRVGWLKGDAILRWD
ncbi:MAG: hypothetical protein B9S33_20890 [Pedosphaera sp. Tous-C6FEB]|nr:MAG: hypothetical protein B9S33_20890 [Pedosphaera sp. Tous-C6FEB]